MFAPLGSDKQACCPGMAQNQQEGSNTEKEAPTDLSGPQIIAVMDQMAVMEASWHAGHSLAQTVYTCHYLLHQERYADA